MAVTQTELPEGAEVLDLEPAGESLELALELAHRGASETLVRAVGGEEAVEAVREQRAAADGSVPATPGPGI
jgi:hypothetical protein